MKHQFYLATWVLFLSSVPALQASSVPDLLQAEMNAVATDIAGIVRKKGKSTIAVGKFNGAVTQKGDTGAIIQLALAQAFAKVGLTVSVNNPAYEVTGRYQIFDDTRENRERSLDPAKPLNEQVDPAGATEMLGIKISVQLIDSVTGDIAASRPISRLIIDNGTLSRLSPTNRSGPVLKDPRDVNQQIRNSHKMPQVKVLGTQLKGQTGQYAIEVLVKDKDSEKYVPRNMTLEDGLPFVGLHVSDIYGVRLINNSPHEAAVELRIDGINCFEFSDGKNRIWIIDPHSQLDVLGWHRNDKTSTEFKVVGDYPETAAAQLHLQPSTDFGLIHALFSASWENEQQRPADEAEALTRGTGFGADIKFNTQKVTRFIGQVRDELTVRYER